MNIFDVGIILLFIMFIIVGYKNGVIKELVSLLGIIIVFYLSFILKGYIGNILCLVFPFLDFKGSIEGLTTINILLYQAIAFIIIFGFLTGIYNIIIRISKAIQKLINATIILWLPSKILGGIVGFISGIIYLYAVFVILMIPLGNNNLYNESLLINKVIYDTPILSTSTSKYTNSIKEVSILTRKVENNEISTNETNLEILDIMLENNIVDKKTVERLVELNKLKIDNIDSVLNKY